MGRVRISSVSQGWETSMVSWMWMMFRMPVIPRASMMLAMRTVSEVASRRRRWKTTDEAPRRGTVAQRRQVYENDRQQEGVKVYWAVYKPEDGRE